MTPHGGAIWTGATSIRSSRWRCSSRAMCSPRPRNSAVSWPPIETTGTMLFWEFDRGGPIRRQAPDPPPRDFQFPQDENPALAEPAWHPRLADYVYISFTNSIAFSPTDAMPLTRRVKMMMLTESAISATTVLLVAARAVNILR